MLLDDGQCELFFLWTPWNVCEVKNIVCVSHLA
jgi:hypothetical protein